MRTSRIVPALLLLVTVALADADKAKGFRFGKDSAGKLPAGWKATQTGKGEGSAWKVQADESAPSKSGFVLAQTAKSPKNLFNLCIAPDVAGKDVEISVAFKANAGDLEQGGGLVWRYQDAENYYVARMNPLEGNYRVYKVIAGARKQLETAEDLKVKAGEWHTLKIRHVGDRIECFLDGKKELDAKDDAITKAGGIGLWTKADAQTSFDDLKVMDITK